MQLAQESFGFLTSRGLAAWAVAGMAAYIYFVVPQQREERDAMVRAPSVVFNVRCLCVLTSCCCMVDHQYLNAAIVCCHAHGRSQHGAGNPGCMVCAACAEPWMSNQCACSCGESTRGEERWSVGTWRWSGAPVAAWRNELRSHAVTCSPCRGQGLCRPARSDSSREAFTDGN
jgi:hypothetical protein